LCRRKNGVRGKNGSEILPRKRKKRDTVNYTLRSGRKVVYKGVTNNPERRATEHRGEGKKFTSMTTSRRVSRPTALKREKIQIKEFKRNKGKVPKYNKRK